MGDGVDPFDGLGLVVKDQIAVVFFLIGEDFDKNETADNRVENLGIIQGLILIGYVL